MLIDSERIRGIAVRHSTIVIALRYKVIAYRLNGLGGSELRTSDPKGKSKAVDSFDVNKIGEWETAENGSGSFPLPAFKSVKLTRQDCWL